MVGTWHLAIGLSGKTTSRRTREPMGDQAMKGFWCSAMVCVIIRPGEKIFVKHIVAHISVPVCECECECECECVCARVCG